MTRRLGAVGTGIFATDGLTRVARRATAQAQAVHSVMPKKLVMPSTGTRVIFGA